MDLGSLSYVEKLENLYVLMETKQMLEQKEKELPKDSKQIELVQEDLRKIKQEMELYTNGQTIDFDKNELVLGALFNPSLVEEMGQE
ncbi:hypothetical protein [Bacillus alkalicellulosilyticus]|uniref:hypothetical protein n=1 Tax=Alkalihalobacterium alkalicellulosilyticum TaxID=1912214 RepID=UPI0009961C76|nr:hypothetical protein [Bacillus alkalicellulosilyticus]